MQVLPETILKDIKTIEDISIISSLLDVVCRSTGMGFAAIARVTEERWVACAVKDDISFGLKPGEELKLESTLCNEIRQHGEPVIIDDVKNDTTYCGHHTPATYGFQSYISIPIFLKDGSFFGTLCAIDPKPAKLKNPATIGMFRLFADLVAFHIQAAKQLSITENSLIEERQAGELKEQFMAILGHDLRNPLTSIMGSAEFILATSANESDVQLAGLIKKSALRMSGLVHDMLDFASGRLGQGIVLKRRSTDDLEKSLQHIISEIASAEPNRIIAAFNITQPVNCDPDRITQLFSNLLKNAVVHGAADTLVKVDVSNAKGKFILSVTNSGNKIPDAVKERLFQPFSRGGKTDPKGLGLGLYISAEIAKAHGATLTVDSTHEKTSFVLEMYN